MMGTTVSTMHHPGYDNPDAVVLAAGPHGMRPTWRGKRASFYYCTHCDFTLQLGEPGALGKAVEHEGCRYPAPLRNVLKVLTDFLVALGKPKPMSEGVGSTIEGYCIDELNNTSAINSIIDDPNLHLGEARTFGLPANSGDKLPGVKSTHMPMARAIPRALRFAWTDLRIRSELTIKDRHGDIQDKRTYGEDPRRTKG